MNDLEFGVAALLLEVPCADEDDAAAWFCERCHIAPAPGVLASIRKPDKLQNVVRGVDSEPDEVRLEQISVLCSPTFWSFSREFSPFQGGRRRSMDSESDPGDSSARWSSWDRVGAVSVRPALPRGARVRKAHRRHDCQPPAAMGPC
jgi:hypothetical protein